MCHTRSWGSKSRSAAEEFSACVIPRLWNKTALHPPCERFVLFESNAAGYAWVVTKTCRKPRPPDPRAGEGRHLMISLACVPFPTRPSFVQAPPRFPAG